MSEQGLNNCLLHHIHKNLSYRLLSYGKKIAKEFIGVRKQELNIEHVHTYYA